MGQQVGTRRNWPKNSQTPSQQRLPKQNGLRPRNVVLAHAPMHADLANPRFLLIAVGVTSGPGIFGYS